MKRGRKAKGYTSEVRLGVCQETEDAIECLSAPGQRPKVIREAIKIGLEHLLDKHAREAFLAIPGARVAAYGVDVRDCGVDVREYRLHHYVSGLDIYWELWLEGCLVHGGAASSPLEAAKDVIKAIGIA